MMLHFAFVATTVFITGQCFGCCRTELAQCQGLLFFLSAPSQPVELGVSKKLGGHTAPTAGLGYLQGCPPPYHVMLSYKNWGRGRRKGVFGFILTLSWPRCSPASALPSLFPVVLGCGCMGGVSILGCSAAGQTGSTHSNHLQFSL